MARSGKWSPKVRYIVTVLWLHGEASERHIAGVITKAQICGAMTKGQVSGIVNTSGTRGLDLAARQDALDKLKISRLDDGILPDQCFTASRRS